MNSTPHSSHPSSAGLEAFREAHNFRVDDLRITHARTIQNHHHIYNGSGRPIELSHILNPLYDASHRRNRKVAPPDSQCMSGTREAVLRDMCSWVKTGILSGQPPDEPGPTKISKPVCWMYGSFGCGKSAIAQTMAEQYGREKRLAAAFFFFRNAGDRSNTIRFANTLAHQIVLNVPGAKEFIQRAVDANPDLLDPSCSLELQLQHLVFEPLLACLAESDIPWDDPFLIVVDGLDECADEDGIATFIDHIIAFFSANPDTPLRIFITSRVEEHIRASIEGGTEVIHLMDLSSRASRSDIQHFMSAYFAEERKRDRALQALGEPWPAPGVLDTLVDYSDGSFIFASTLARFIVKGSGKADPRTPNERLHLALKIDPGIDGVYMEVLSRAQGLPHFHAIIATIAYLEMPLSVSGLSVLLGLPKYEVLRVLVLLQAIIQVPGLDDVPVNVFHTSLRDFLVNKSRSGLLYSPPSHHTVLLHRCLELCFGTTPTANAECRLYAVMHWFTHLAAAADLDEQHDIPLTANLGDSLHLKSISPRGTEPHQPLHEFRAYNDDEPGPLLEFRHPRLPWRIRVRPAGRPIPNTHFTLAQTMRLLHDKLSIPVTQQEWTLLSPRQQKDSSTAFYNRVNWPQEEEQRNREHRKGVKRVDLLGNQAIIVASLQISVSRLSTNLKPEQVLDSVEHQWEWITGKEVELGCKDCVRWLPWFRHRSVAHSPP